MQVSTNVSINCTFAAAAASTSSFSLIFFNVSAANVTSNTSNLTTAAAQQGLVVNPASVRSGDRVYVRMRLLTAAEQLVYSAANVQLNITGSVSGPLPRAPLARLVDGNWTTNFTAGAEENITVTGTLDGKPWQQLVLQVLPLTRGVNPFHLNVSAATSGAQLLSQGLKATDAVLPGSSLLIYTGEQSLLQVPALDLLARR
jgi:hypothetical protein